MAALTITVANIVPAAGFSAESAYLAGATITRGQAVYLDASTNTWKLADCDASAAAAGSAGLGISLSDVVATQPMLVMIAGTLAFGAILTNGGVYIVGGTAAGDIAPVGDLTTSWRLSILGVANGTSNLIVRPWATGIVK